jgi:hypothetical protein
MNSVTYTVSPAGDIHRWGSEGPAVSCDAIILVHMALDSLADDAFDALYLSRFRHIPIDLRYQVAIQSGFRIVP